MKFHSNEHYTDLWFGWSDKRLSILEIVCMVLLILTDLSLLAMIIPLFVNAFLIWYSPRGSVNAKKYERINNAVTKMPVQTKNEYFDPSNSKASMYALQARQSMNMKSIGLSSSCLDDLLSDISSTSMSSTSSFHSVEQKGRMSMADVFAKARKSRISFFGQQSPKSTFVNPFEVDNQKTEKKETDNVLTTHDKSAIMESSTTDSQYSKGSQPSRETNAEQLRKTINPKKSAISISAPANKVSRWKLTRRYTQAPSAVKLNADKPAAESGVDDNAEDADDGVKDAQISDGSVSIKRHSSTGVEGDVMLEHQNQPKSPRKKNKNKKGETKNVSKRKKPKKNLRKAVVPTTQKPIEMTNLKSENDVMKIKQKKLKHVPRRSKKIKQSNIKTVSDKTLKISPTRSSSFKTMTTLQFRPLSKPWEAEKFTKMKPNFNYLEDLIE